MCCVRNSVEKIAPSSIKLGFILWKLPHMSFRLEFIHVTFFLLFYLSRFFFHVLFFFYFWKLSGTWYLNYCSAWNSPKSLRIVTLSIIISLYYPITINSPLCRLSRASLNLVHPQFNLFFNPNKLIIFLDK